MSGTGGARSWYLGQVCDAALLANGVPTQRPGAAIQITASVAGTVILTLVSGATIVVNPPVGDSIYPYQVVMAAAGTATVTAYYNLFH
jgi:hypothetical protein